MKTLISTLMLAVLFLTGLAKGENKVIKDTKNSKEATEAIVLMGTVVDQSTGEALPGAQVRINGNDQILYTDLDGNFEVRNLKPGNYSLDITLVSYDESKIRNLVIDPETKSALKVELKR